jgi:hypothetical protein
VFRALRFCTARVVIGRNRLNSCFLLTGSGHLQFATNAAAILAILLGNGSLADASGTALVCG